MKRSTQASLGRRLKAAKMNSRLYLLVGMGLLINFLSWLGWDKD